MKNNVKFPIVLPQPTSIRKFSFIDGKVTVSVLPCQAIQFYGNRLVYRVTEFYKSSHSLKADSLETICGTSAKDGEKFNLYTLRNEFTEIDYVLILRDFLSSRIGFYLEKIRGFQHLLDNSKAVLDSLDCLEYSSNGKEVK